MKKLILILMVAFCLLNCTQQKAKEVEKTVKPKGLIEYAVADVENVSYPGTERLVIRVVIKQDSLPSEARLKAMSEYIWSDGNKVWDEFTVLSYMQGMNTNQLAYGVAEFRQYGMIEFSTNDLALWETKW